jgi:hypothetical protein
VSASLHTPTREPAVHVQQQLTVRQPRFESPAGEHPMDPRPRSARHQGDEVGECYISYRCMCQ